MKNSKFLLFLLIVCLVKSKDPVSILSKNIAVNNVLAGRCVKEIDRTKNVQLKEKSTGLVLSQDK